MHKFEQQFLKAHGFDPDALEWGFHTVHYKRGIHPDDVEDPDEYEDHRDTDYTRHAKPTDETKAWYV